MCLFRASSLTHFYTIIFNAGCSRELKILILGKLDFPMLLRTEKWYSTRPEIDFSRSTKIQL